MGVFLNEQSYSLVNSLDWSLCKDHFNEALNNQRNKTYRLFHATICLAETLPILGQIASLFELCVVKAIMTFNRHLKEEYIINNDRISIYNGKSNFKIHINLFGYLISYDHQKKEQLQLLNTNSGQVQGGKNVTEHTINGIAENNGIAESILVSQVDLGGTSTSPPIEESVIEDPEIFAESILVSQADLGGTSTSPPIEESVIEDPEIFDISSQVKNNYTEVRAEIVKECGKILDYIISEECSLDGFYKQESSNVVLFFININKDMNWKNVCSYIDKQNGSYCYTEPISNIPIHIAPAGIGRSRDILISSSLEFIKSFKKLKKHQLQDVFLSKTNGNCIEGRINEAMNYYIDTFSRIQNKLPVLETFTDLMSRHFNEAEKYFKIYRNQKNEPLFKRYARHIINNHNNERCIPDQNWCPSGTLCLAVVERYFQAVLLE